MFLLEDPPYSLYKEEKDLLGFSSCYKSLGIVAIVIGIKVGPIYYYSGLRGGSKKRGGSGMPLLVTALIYIRD